MTARRRAPSSDPPSASHRHRIGPLALVVVLVGAVALLRATVMVPVRVDSASMLPTFGAGDVVLTSRSRPEVDDLRRGDLIVFRSPDDGGRALKRIVGLPDDVLVVKDSRLYVNDRRVPEPYVDHALIDGYYSRTFTVPRGHVFVMGDNRGNSVDSRDYGAIAGEDVLGRVLLRVWPVTR